MKRNEWKRHMQQEAWNHVPDQWEAIHSRLDGTPQEAPQPLRSRWLRPQMMAISGLLVALLLTFFLLIRPASAPLFTEAYVSIDINPSLELLVDHERYIVAQTPKNQAARILLAGTNLLGMNLDEAITVYLDRAIEAGYLDVTTNDNAVLVQAVHESATWERELQQQLQTKAEQLFATRHVYGVVLVGQGSAEMKQAAAAAGLTIGKYYVIQTLVAANPALEWETLQGESMRTLHALLATSEVQTQQLQQQSGQDFDALSIQYEQYLTHPNGRNRQLVQAQLGQLNENYGTTYRWNDLNRAAIGQWRSEVQTTLDVASLVNQQQQAFQQRTGQQSNKLNGLDLPQLRNSLAAQCDQQWKNQEQARYAADWANIKRQWAEKFVINDPE